MFDIGISEIMVIAVVALIVLGPEKLPKTARTLGHLFGRLQRYVGEVKADINRELAIEDLKKLQAEVSSAATDFADVDVHDGEGSGRQHPRSRSEPQRCGRETSAPARAPVAERGAAPEAAPEALPTAPAESVPRETPQQASLPGFERG